MYQSINRIERERVHKSYFYKLSHNLLAIALTRLSEFYKSTSLTYNKDVNVYRHMSVIILFC